MDGKRGIAVGVGVALSILLAVSLARAEEGRMLQEVSPAVAEKPQDSLLMMGTYPWDPEILAAMDRYQVTLGGKPAGGQNLDVDPRYGGGIMVGARNGGGPTTCEWVMPTPRAGDYVVSLLLLSGDERPGRFGFYSGATKYESEEFRQKRSLAGLVKAFRITAPPGQERTKMFLTGDGMSVWRVDISPVTRPIEDLDGKILRLAESSYRTVLRAAGEQSGTPSCLVLAPREGVEAAMARELAGALKLNVAEEPELAVPFPQDPALKVAGPDTNLILLSAGTGGPIVRAMRRAGLIAENYAIPGAGGFTIRTVARPFNGKANVIVISGGDEAGLAKGIKAFQPARDPATGDLVWDRFLVDSPGERWAKLREPYYRYADDNPYWDREAALLKMVLDGANLKSEAPARAYIHHTTEIADEYWLTGNIRFADLFKQRMLKMEEDDIYGGKYGTDSHLVLNLLIQAWNRVEEAPVFTAAERLRITNYLLLRCVLGVEGFGHAYNGAARYFGSIHMRHGHQVMLATGMMQAYLYFGRLYGLGCADIWKSWCDDIINEGTAWGHDPTNSFHYECKAFRLTADLLHYQGISAADGPECTRTWPAAALRFMSVRGSLGLPACYGDCGDGADSETIDPTRWDFFGVVMRDDFHWPLAQFAIDEAVRGYRSSYPNSFVASETFAYLNGSTDVGGILPAPSPEARRMADDQLLGLVALPMPEGYWRYMTGQVGNTEFWKTHPRPEAIPYAKTADKVVYRGGWDVADESMVLETLGWCEHGHMELGAIVQYCQGGRLWVVENGYNNWGVENCSTLEVKRDGKPAWDHFEGQHGRFFDFRTGSQMFEIVQLERGKPGVEPFRILCRAKDMAGATWLRAVSGGDNKGLHVEDTLTAQEPGEYQMVFRLRLLGRVAGENGQWQVAQNGAVLPIALELQKGDSAAAAWVPDSAASFEGAYPWYAFIQGMAKQPGEPVRGAPKTIEWKRTIRLAPGQATVFRATLGPSEKVSDGGAFPKAVIVAPPN